ncbi:MAG TPA: NAD(P)-dependent oxidoreductase [Nitrososphaeraceae archaeon]
MIIKILSKASGFESLLSHKLATIGFRAETVNYEKPLPPQIEDADVLVNGLGIIDEKMIECSSRLKLVHQMGIGIDNVDLAYCKSRGIYVANVPHSNHVSVAEHTIFLMIYLAKNIKSAEIGIMRRRVVNVLGSELKGKTLTIIGLGATGIEVANRARCLGLKVLAITKHPKRKRELPNRIQIDDVRGTNALQASISQSDFISIHTPLTDETKGMIGSREFNILKPTALLVNVARAAIVNREQLYAALSKGKIAGAGFDVFWEEPANPNDKLLKLDNFVLTPHIAGWTKEFAALSVNIITRNIAMISKGLRPLTAVNSVSK